VQGESFDMHFAPTEEGDAIPKVEEVMADLEEQVNSMPQCSLMHPPIIRAPWERGDAAGVCSGSTHGNPSQAVLQALEATWCFEVWASVHIKDVQYTLILIPFY